MNIENGILDKATLLEPFAIVQASNDAERKIDVLRPTRWPVGIQSEFCLDPEDGASSFAYEQHGA